MTNWKYTDKSNAAVSKTNPDGSIESCLVSAIGDWLADGNTPEPATPTPAAQIWEAIKAERDRRKASGVKVGAKWYHSDDSSRIQQLGLLMMGASISASLKWKTMDGSFVSMTQTLAGQVFGAVAASDQAIFAQAEAHRLAMEASSSPASYDYSTGWPAEYTA